MPLSSFGVPRVRYAIVEIVRSKVVDKTDVESCKYGEGPPRGSKACRGPKLVYSRLAPSLFRQSKKIGKGKIRKGESEIDLCIPGPHE